MTTHGRPYEGKNGENIPFTGRAVYITPSAPTIEQRQAIERIERGIHGDWEGKNPYAVMRYAEFRGVELYEERKGEDGKWHRVESPDALMTLMEKGAL